MGDTRPFGAIGRRRRVNEGSSASLVIDAPAKLNLGLEVLRRRDDGFHDLATIFLTVSLFDRLSFSVSSESRVDCDACDVAQEDNLVQQALALIQPPAAVPPLAVTLRKGIPVAAGLGGASSDAAATLLGARALWQLPYSDGDLTALALELGSDVPFFLDGGCALGRGRGEILVPLPLPQGVWFVLVVPTLHIRRKTALLYANLSPDDFSDGSAVKRQAARLRSVQTVNSELMHNAFSRPLYTLVPDLITLAETMREAGAMTVAVSGAGPAHYAIVDHPEVAIHIADTLRERLGTQAGVFVVAPVPARNAAS